MIVRELISESALPVSRNDTVGDALSLAVYGELTHLPVVDEDRRLVGMIRLSSLLKEPDVSRSVGDLPFDAPFSIFEEAHLYDAIQLVVEHEADLVSVVDADGKYVGSIGLSDVLIPVSRLLATPLPGSIVDVELSGRDYSLRDLVLAIEQTGAKVLSIGTAEADRISDTVTVIVKVSVEDTSRIRAVLEHVGYHVTRSTGRSIRDVELQHRVAELMHYLDV